MDARSSFITEGLLSWEVLGIGVSILIAVGFTMAADEFRQFRAARVCFTVTALWLFGKVAMWGIYTSEKISVRAGVTALVCAVVGIGLVEAIRLTVNREAEVARSESAHIPPTPLSSPVIGHDTRQFTNRTPRELLAFYENLTPLQADSLMTPFKGMWVRVTGRVKTVDMIGGGSIGVVIGDHEGAETVCDFQQHWREALSRLNKNDEISAEGRISEGQSGTYLSLTDCDLVQLPSTGTKTDAISAPLRGAAGAVPSSALDKKSPIDRLSEIGWTVRPGVTDIGFEIASKPIPDMEASAACFKELRKPFRLHFQLVKSIGGLHLLAGIGGCTKIEISAGEFADISELDGLSQITSLSISQTPIDGLSTINLSPISSLNSLRELNLFSSKFTDLGPISKLSKLTVLNLKDTPVRDLSPLAGLISVESLDITGTGTDSLLPLRGMEMLRELGVGARQVRHLAELGNLKGLKVLRIIDKGPVDLSPVAVFASLESLFIWGPPAMNMAPLGSLSKLQGLQISGLGFDGLSTVTGIEALGNLQELTRLTLGSLQVSDLSFVRKLGLLNEINVGMMPVASIEPLRGLASLKSVSLNLTEVVDISPLLELPALTSLSVLQTPARADVLTRLEKNGVKIRR